MITNPFLNAFLAAGYIAGLVFFIFNVVAQPGRVPEDTILIPILMLSLFTLSAAVMSYLFLAQPLMLYHDGKKQEAITFFFTTVLAFACITAVLLAALFVVI